MSENISETLISQEAPSLLLVGTPNVGKSVLFGILTGRYVTVSNYPGTTVEVAHGPATIHGARYIITDTPGVNNLIPMSADEAVTRDILLDKKDAHAIQVCDAKNLKQALFITLQLAEMNIPMSMALNMWDEALDRRINIDVHALATLVGVSVTPTIATHRTGLSELYASTADARIPHIQIEYAPEIEKAIQQITQHLPPEIPCQRTVSLSLLSGDRSMHRWIMKHFTLMNFDEIEHVIIQTQKTFARPLSYVINEMRQKEAEKITKQVLKPEAAKPKTSLGHTIGHIAMHPIRGIPMLLLVLYSMYFMVGYIGADLAVGFLEEYLFGGYLIPWLTKGVEMISPVQGVTDLLVGPYGILSMALTYAIALILPIVTFFFIFFGILEDSGYLPRLAIMSDKVFRLMGLNGKSILPMVLGLGCGTMATMTTRILETKWERLLVTLLLAVGVPCSAQLGVILGVINPMHLPGMIWVMVTFGSIVLVGFVASRILPGRKSDFILELPPMRLPKLRNIFYKTYARLQWYLKEAVPMFIYGTIFLFVADRMIIGDLSMIQWLEYACSPIVEDFLGLPGAITQCFILGFLRRDYAAVGILQIQTSGVDVLNNNQLVVAMVVITLFIPCIAHFLVMIKEQGAKRTLAITTFVMAYAFGIGGLLNWLFHVTNIKL